MMNGYLKQLSKNLSTPLQPIVVIVSILLLGIAGPFGTFGTMGLWERMFYWSVVVLSSTLTVHLIRAAIERVLPNLSYFRKALVVATLAAVLYSPALNIFAHWMSRGEREVTLLWMIMVMVFSITLMVFVMVHFQAVKNHQQLPRLFSRFSDPKIQTICRVTVRDHYVDVYTDRGTETLLMRFADVLAELDGLEGMQVHRSHWVARNCAASVIREKGRAFLMLESGIKIPISRGNQDDVMAVFG